MKLKKILFFKGEPLDLNEVSDLETIVKIKKLIKNNQAKIEYLVENKAKKKQVAAYLLTKTRTEYQDILGGIRTTAKTSEHCLIISLKNITNIQNWVQLLSLN